MPPTPKTAARADLRGVPESRVSTRSEFELREIPNGTGGVNLRFTGFASVTDAEYEMEDIFGTFVESVAKGAFQKTLADGADCAFLVNHSGLTLARTRSGTLKLSEVTNKAESPIKGICGLYSEAMLDPQNPHVIAIRSAVERGDLSEMSFAFRCTRDEWNKPDFDRRVIREVSLAQGDVSLVNYGASPHTGGTVSLRQKHPGDGRFLHLADRDYLAARRRLTQIDADDVAIQRARIALARSTQPPRADLMAPQRLALRTPKGLIT